MSNGYAVWVDDNYKFMDSNARSNGGQYATLDEAIRRCKKIVDEYLDSAFKPGMTADDMYASYTMFGEDPFIVGGPAGGPLVPFSAWDYAKQRCQELASARETASKSNA